MPDLNERLGGIDRLSPPDLWSVARAKAEPGVTVATNPSGWQRAALIAASLVLGLGAVAWVMVAVRTTSSPPVSSAQPIVSPAPRGDCPFGLVRSSPVGTTEFARLMKGYLPTWMPQGFGLLASFSPEQSADGFGGYGIWSDDTCREVELTFNSTGRSAGHVNPGNRPSVGPWVVEADVPGGCFNQVLGKTRCIDYSAATPDGFLSLLMMGVDREEGDRIALSIFDGSSSEPAPTHYWIRFPDRPTTTEGGLQVVVNTNLPEGTLYLVNTPRSGACCPAVHDGQIVLNMNDAGQLETSQANGCAALKDGNLVESTDLRIRITVDSDIGKHVIGVQVLPSSDGGPVNGGIPQQPDSVRTVLGQHFENLSGDQVTKTPDGKQLVATVHYPWRVPRC